MATHTYNGINWIITTRELEIVHCWRKCIIYMQNVNRRTVDGLWLCKWRTYYGIVQKKKMFVYIFLKNKKNYAYRWMLLQTSDWQSLDSFLFSHFYRIWVFCSTMKQQMSTRVVATYFLNYTNSIRASDVTHAAIFIPSISNSVDRFVAHCNFRNYISNTKSVIYFNRN